VSGFPLSVKDLAWVEARAKQAWPEEACALIVGRGDPPEALRLVPCTNIAEDKRRRFEVDPAERIRLEMALRGTPERLVGIWHSHPDGMARPSVTDASMVYEPALVWLITGCSNGRTCETKAFRPKGDGFEDMGIEGVE
jgi:proteasome lid subunit RPN8/RPN11